MVKPRSNKLKQREDGKEIKKTQIKKVKLLDTNWKIETLLVGNGKFSEIYFTKW